MVQSQQTFNVIISDTIGTILRVNKRYFIALFDKIAQIIDWWIATLTTKQTIIV